jgi:reverse gyrase
MLSKQELSEIEQLPELLREKILRVFNSPLYADWDAFDTFITRKWQELKENDFKIIFTADEDSELPVEKLVQKGLSARQEAETALKYAKELPAQREACEALRQKLTEEEKEKSYAKKKGNTVAI